MSKKIAVPVEEEDGTWRLTFPNRYNAGRRKQDFGTHVGDPSLTKQEFVAECDINSIMRRYITQGVLPSNIKIGRYGDFTEVGDYQECLTTLENARAQFMAMPSEVRKRFGNDPANFLEFVMNKDNKEEARKLGLLKEEPEAPPVAAPPPASK